MANEIIILHIWLCNYYDNNTSCFKKLQPCRNEICPKFLLTHLYIIPLQCSGYLKFLFSNACMKCGMKQEINCEATKVQADVKLQESIPGKGIQPKTSENLFGITFSYFKTYLRELKFLVYKF